MLYHAAGMGEHGVIVIDIWDSPESMQAFETKQLQQARQAAHITSHEVTIFPLINIMQP
jgi:heme-degrading monooxygenase HmoA